MWIDRDTFPLLQSLGVKGQMTLDGFKPMEDEEFLVAWDDLTKEQRKMLPSIDRDFKVICHGSTAGTSKVKDRVIKEPYYKKEKIIDLVKFIIRERDREAVFDRIVKSDISPIVIQIWLFRPCYDTLAWNTYLNGETYIYNTIAYASVMCDTSLKTAKFCFPKAVRPKEE